MFKVLRQGKTGMLVLQIVLRGGKDVILTNIDREDGKRRYSANKVAAIRLI